MIHASGYAESAMNARFRSLVVTKGKFMGVLEDATLSATGPGGVRFATGTTHSVSLRRIGFA